LRHREKICDSKFALLIDALPFTTVAITITTQSLLLVLGSEGSDGLSGAPDLQISNLLHLSLVLLTVIWLGVVVEGSLGLLAGLDRVVKVVENWLQGVLELSGPVDGTTSGGGGAGLVHPVHAVGTDQWVQGLGSLLDGLVEGLRWAVALLTENLVLGEEHTVNTSHQATTLTVQVGVDLLLKGSLVKVAGADGDTEGDGLLLSLASNILEDGNGGVDSTALLKERSDRTSRSLWCNEDDINVSWDLHLGKVLEDWGETVGEVQSLHRLAIEAGYEKIKCMLTFPLVN
jgi:hypothetical protein